MKKFVRIIDDNGYFVRDDFVDVDELCEKTIETPCPAGFYLPKWDGIQWVEGGDVPETGAIIEPLTLESLAEAFADHIGGAL